MDQQSGGRTATMTRQSEACRDRSQVARTARQTKVPVSHWKEKQEQEAEQQNRQQQPNFNLVA